jgi:hypothetical protein
MPTGPIISQFNRSEFFATLPSGFYVFFILYSFYEICINGTQLCFSQMVYKLASQTKDQPVLLVFIIFACYLIGSIFRALPVQWIENSTIIFVPIKNAIKAISDILNPKTEKEEVPRKFYKFPYPDILDKMLINIEDSKKQTFIERIPESIRKLDEKAKMAVFNYWKAAICLQDIESFSYYQTFETRVRFFSSLICAGWLGIILSLFIYYIDCYNNNKHICQAW